MRTFILIFFFVPAFSAAYSQSGTSVYQDSSFVAEILQQHNAFRSELQLPSLQWSASLAEDALAWAQHLAKSGRGQHDPRVGARREGENIWWGTAGAFSYGQMVGFWGGEKQDFQYGTFPDCKTSGNAMIGHYTQLVWKTTNHVGCALASDGKTDFLVCRYSPPGNIEGQKPY